MKFPKLTISTLALAAAFTAAALVPINASASQSGSSDQDLPNIVETAVAVNAQSGEFSTLIAAVSCTNLIDKLQSDYREYTVFAPTDAAFAKLGLNAENVCASFTRHDLTEILRYHITRDALSSADVLGAGSLTMKNGEEAPIAGATIAGQNIVTTDVEASNGMIHVIDGVMLP